MKTIKLAILLAFFIGISSCAEKTALKNTDDTGPHEISEHTDPPNFLGEQPEVDPDAHEGSDPPPPGLEYGSMKRSNASYKSAKENLMVDEINFIRQDPPGYVKYINEYIAKLEKDKAEGMGWGNADEEIATARELIEELKTTPKLSFLEPSENIWNAAKKHGDEGKSLRQLNHAGADGKMPWDRVKAQAPECSDGNENLVGGAESVRISVIMLLVDNGIPNRGHRKTLLNPAWTHTGCYYVEKLEQCPITGFRNLEPVTDLSK